MAAGPAITSGAGLRRAQVFTLDSNGYPSGDEADDDGYDGVNMEGVRSMTLTAPSIQPLQHVGNDRLFAQDYLPPTEGLRAELATAKQNLSLDAILTDTSTVEVGEATIGGMFTSQQGNEVDVCVLVSRQALDTTDGSQQVRRWQTYLFPMGRIVPRGASPEQGSADENGYDFIPTVATEYPWGHAFTDADEGYTSAQMLRSTTENPVVMERWDGNGTLDTFNLSWTPISTAKTAVFADGVAATVSSVSTTLNTVTLDSAPSNDAVLVAYYETSDDI